MGGCLSTGRAEKLRIRKDPVVGSILSSNKHVHCCGSLVGSLCVNIKEIKDEKSEEVERLTKARMSKSLRRR